METAGRYLPGTQGIDEGIEALRTTLSLAAMPAEKPDGASLAGVADELTDGAARHATDRPDDITVLLATLRQGDEPCP